MVITLSKMDLNEEQETGNFENEIYEFSQNCLPKILRF